METAGNGKLSNQENIKNFSVILLAEGLADEVRPGVDIKEGEYTFLRGDEFAVTDTVGVLSRFLALPMYIDSFPDHETRITAFNQASADGKISKEQFDNYFKNKLRTNRLSAVVSNVSTLARMRGNPPELKAFLNEECPTVSLVGYSELSLAAKLEKVAEVENLAIVVLNKMIELGVMQGPVVTKD